MRRNEVAILRQVIEKLVPMISKTGVKVTQRGLQAFVKYDSKGRPTVVNLPMLPDDAADDLVLAIQGFLDHEVGHILDSSFEYLVKSTKAGPSVGALTNMVEDTYVERRMRERFPGSAFNIDLLHDFFLENITRPGLEKATTIEEKLGYLTVTAIRAWSGQRVFKEFMDAGNHWDTIAPYFKKVPQALIDRIKTVKSSRDSFEIAVALDMALRPPKPPESDEKPEDGEGEKRSGEGDGDGKPTKSDDSDADSAPKPGDKGEDEPDEGEPAEDNDDNDESEEQDSDGEPHDDGAADEGEEDGEGAGDDDEPTDDAEDGAGEDEGESGEDDPSDSDEGAAEPSDDAGDDADEGAGQGGGEDEDEDAESASSGDDEGESGEGESDSGEGSDADKADARDGTEEIWDSVLGEGCPNSEFDEALSKVIGDRALEMAAEADYHVFTKDADKVELLEPMIDASQVQRLTNNMDDKTRHMIGVMQKQIERMVAARSQVLNVPGYRSGRLHTAALHRITLGDDRAFRRKQVNHSKDTAVTLLVDCSGSMGGSKFQTAMLAAYALSLTLDRVGIKHECLGFTTGNDYDLYEEIKKEQDRTGLSFSRHEPLYMPIFKQFEERVTPQVKARFAVAERQISLANNIDGESVEVAAGRLMQRRETRKILIVLSDGQPNFYGDTRAGAQHLKKVVKELPKKGVEPIGIGIEDRSVKSYYPKFVVLDDVEQLPAQVMKELQTILMQ
jgi:hypothetical protein